MYQEDLIDFTLSFPLLITVHLPSHFVSLRSSADEMKADDGMMVLSLGTFLTSFIPLRSFSLDGKDRRPNNTQREEGVTGGRYPWQENTRGDSKCITE